MKQIPQEINDLLVWKEPRSNAKDDDMQFPYVTGIRHSAKPCEDCGASVKDRRVEYSQRNTPYVHWQEKCTNCNLYKDPDTGKFSLNSQEYSTVLRLYKKKKAK